MAYSFVFGFMLFYPTLGIEMTVDTIRKDQSMDFRNGFLFQERGVCKQAMSEEEGQLVKSSNATNMIIMEGNTMGRTGNRFIDVSQYFGMAYCCKSGLLELPLEDEVFPSMDGIFKANKRFFDFSDAELPLEFDGLSEKT